MCCVPTVSSLLNEKTVTSGGSDDDLCQWGGIFELLNLGKYLQS